MYYPKNKNSDQHVDKVQRVQESSGLCFIPVASVRTSRGDMICLRVVTFQQSWLFTSFYFWLAVGPSPHPVFIIQLQWHVLHQTWHREQWKEINVSCTHSSSLNTRQLIKNCWTGSMLLSPAWRLVWTLGSSITSSVVKMRLTLFWIFSFKSKCVSAFAQVDLWSLTPNGSITDQLSLWSSPTGDLPQHLQVMINILRSEDRIKLVRDDISIHQNKHMHALTHTGQWLTIWHSKTLQNAFYCVLKTLICSL